MEATIISDTFTKRSEINEESENKLWWIDLEKIEIKDEPKTITKEEKDLKKCPTFTKTINCYLIPEEKLGDYFIMSKLPFYITKRENYLEDFIELDIKVSSLKINISNATEIDDMGFRINTDYINQRKRELEQLKLEYGIK